MKRKCKYDKHHSLLNRAYPSLMMALLLLAVLTGCGSSTKKVESVAQDAGAKQAMKKTYYCPMHPEVEQDDPGICPKPECMGMDLIEKVPTGLLDAVLKPVSSNALSTIKTIMPQETLLTLDIKAQGFIDYDERNKHNIASRYAGRIEKLYVKYNYQPVKPGDKLFEVYSPDLVTAQENLVYLLNSDPDASELIQSAKQKLILLGFSDEQVARLEKSKKVNYSIAVFSKWKGHVHESAKQTPSSSENSEMNAMGSGSSNQPVQVVSSGIAGSSQQSIQLSTKEGMYISAGQLIFQVVNPDRLVAILQIRAEDIARVQLGQVVEMKVNSDTNNKISGKINFIEPLLRTGARTLAVRVDVPNKNEKYKPGTWLSSSIKTEPVEGLFIPAKAVIDLGRDKMVWIKKDGYFVARKIETGVVNKDWVEIYDGITRKDEIAAEAHYLNDSESFIKDVKTDE